MINLIFTVIIATTPTTIHLGYMDYNSSYAYSSEKIIIALCNSKKSTEPIIILNNWREVGWLWQASSAIDKFYDEIKPTINDITCYKCKNQLMNKIKNLIEKEKGRKHNAKNNIKKLESLLIYDLIPGPTGTLEIGTGYSDDKQRN